jgi:hypothetical protein
MSRTAELSMILADLTEMLDLLEEGGPFILTARPIRI